MGSRTIRVDREVYRLLVAAKARLEMATAKPQSLSQTVRFLLALDAL